MSHDESVRGEPVREESVREESVREESVQDGSAADDLVRNESAEDESAEDEPAEDEPAWSEEEDDRTAETLRWLREKRKSHRRRKGRDIAVLVYSIVLLGAGYGGGYAVYFLRRLRLGADYSDVGAHVQAALPAFFTLLTAALALLAARDALWRGPVVVPAPSVGWLLAQPVRRAVVLRPWFWLSAGVSAATALVAAVAAAVVLRVLGLASPGGALLALLPAAVCLPLLAVAAGMAAEHRAGLAGFVRRFSPLAVVVLMLLAGQTAAAAAGHRSAVLEQVELWSGPWGWAAQPVVSATGGHAPGWPAAVVLLVLLTAAGLVRGHRDAALVPTAQLRRRAATAQTVSSVMYSAELRAAKLALMDAAAAGPGAGRMRAVRLPRPRSKYLVVVWRDLLSLLRTPARLGKALMWLACATAVAALGLQFSGGARAVGLGAALLLGYFAVGVLAEPARLETDDVRRAAWSPFRFRTLMLHHAVVPAVLGALLALLAAVPFAVAGAPWALALMPLCAVPFGAAAVFSASRGPARTDMLFSGVSSPVGDPGVFRFFFWYAAGPLVSAGGLGIVLHGVLRRALDAGAVAVVAGVAAVLTTGLLFFAARSADRLVRPGS